MFPAQTIKKAIKYFFATFPLFWQKKLVTLKEVYLENKANLEHFKIKYHLKETKSWKRLALSSSSQKCFVSELHVNQFNETFFWTEEVNKCHEAYLAMLDRG